MRLQVVERRIRCPFCGESMDIVIDLSAGAQSYVEDCQICCQPMEIGFTTEDDRLLDFRVDRAS